MSDSPSVKSYLPPAELARDAHVSGMSQYLALCAEAEADYSGYWARLARETVIWKTPFTRSLDDSAAPFFKWFEDGTLNASFNCLDRQVNAGMGDKIAITALAGLGSKLIAIMAPKFVAW